MKIESYNGRSSSGRTKCFTVTGPKGTIQIGVTYTDRKKNGVFFKREFQVDEINTGSGWTDECPDTRAILLNTIGETFKGKRDRIKWLEAVYTGSHLPKTITSTEKDY